MVSLPKKKVGIVSCSGEDLPEGTVTRLAALKVLEHLRPSDTVTICLPLFLAGHDFRSYSASVKVALVSGLMAAGCKVHDIGLAVTPMAYFSQFDLDVPCVAMVTASHNDNGWTGVKLGAKRPLTFGPDEMTRL